MESPLFCPFYEKLFYRGHDRTRQRLKNDSKDSAFSSVHPKEYFCKSGFSGFNFFAIQGFILLFFCCLEDKEFVFNFCRFLFLNGKEGKKGVLS